MSFERMTFEDVSDLAHSYSVGLISIDFTLFLTINFKSLQCLKIFISLVIKNVEFVFKFWSYTKRRNLQITTILHKMSLVKGLEFVF